MSCGTPAGYDFNQIFSGIGAPLAADPAAVDSTADALCPVVFFGISSPRIAPS